MEQVIAYMKELGWVEEGGRIQHPDINRTFANWMDAIRACIEVASEF
jgi:hypothetical protein